MRSSSAPVTDHRPAPTTAAPMQLGYQCLNLNNVSNQIESKFQQLQESLLISWWLPAQAEVGISTTQLVLLVFLFFSLMTPSPVITYTAQHVGFRRSPRAYLSLTPLSWLDLLRGRVGTNYASGGSGILDVTVRKQNQAIEYPVANQANLPKKYMCM